MLIAICEDDRSFSALLADRLTTFFADKGTEIELVSCRNAAELDKEIGTGKSFALIMMDINLGTAADGISTVDRLRKAGNEAPVIFVTSMENRAADGYDVQAFGFVVKRELDTRLPRVLTRLWNEHFCRKTIVTETREGASVIELAAVLCAESDKRATTIHTATGDITDIRSIQHFSALLPSDDFIECYKSIFVSISHIKCVNADTVSMDNGSSFPMSRRNRKTVMSAVMRKVAGR